MHNAYTMPSNKRITAIGKALFVVISLVLITLFVLNASKPGNKVEGYPESCGNALERNPGPLRILSLNILHGFPGFENLDIRIDLIAKEIKRLDADVVLLQEVPWTRKTGNVAESFSQQLGYNYLYYRANGNRKLILFEEGEAILSRFVLNEAVYTELQPGTDFFENQVDLGRLQSLRAGR